MPAAVSTSRREARKKNLMAFSPGNLSAELRRAWTRAFFNALNREAKAIGFEDTLVGLHQEFGELLVKYFEPESAVHEFLDQVRQSAHVHDYSLSKLSEGVKDRLKGGEASISARGLGLSIPMSERLTAVWDAANAYTKSQQRHSVGLRDFMAVLSLDSEAASLLRSRGIEFRKDVESADSDAASRDEAGIVPLDEVMKLFEHWMKTSVRLMCDVRLGDGSIETSLEALFHIIGKVGDITATHGQVRIDAEKATETSCLLDLRGSSTKRETLSPLPGDARMESDPPVRLNTRLATGDRCIITSIPSFAYIVDQNTPTPE